MLAVLREKASAVLGVEDLAEDESFTGRGVDSLAVVELVMDLEDAFGIELGEEEVAAAATVGALADVVVGKWS
ncbi:MAG: Phosphopantetheine attachment site [Frankiales bacterium]|nr:Phosphopantetheine attachment site [Frankiales bacterium]